jgi:hypothetical protein
VDLKDRFRNQLKHIDSFNFDSVDDLDHGINLAFQVIGCPNDGATTLVPGAGKGGTVYQPHKLGTVEIKKRTYGLIVSEQEAINFFFFPLNFVFLYLFFFFYSV